MATRMKMTVLMLGALLGSACGGKGEASQKEEHAHGEHSEGEHAEGEKGEHAEGEKGEHGEGEEGEHAEGVVELTPEQLASARLAFGVVEQRSAAGLLRATAQIEAAGQRQARLGPRVAGRVAAVKVSLGQEVKKGAVLAVVDSPELGRATADYLAAIAQAKVARETANREKTLYDKKISSEKDWREAEAAAVSRRAEKEAAEGRLHALGVSDRSLPTRVDGHYSSRVSITSPLEGIVVESTATLGQMVESTDSLFTVMDLQEVWVVMDVYERDLAEEIG